MKIGSLIPDIQGVILRPIDRVDGVQAIRKLLDQFPIVGIVGSRQIGKTTLARMIADTFERTKTKVTKFDLEDPNDLAALQNSMETLAPLQGLVIVDEVQRKPDLFPILRVLADRPSNRAQFLILGSTSPELLKQSSESLAGRIAYYHLDGFGLDEVGVGNCNKLWIRGGYPKSYLAKNDDESAVWRREFLQTFRERDLAQFGIIRPPETIRIFLNMLAHYHGQTWNAAEFARALGVAEKTVRSYLDILVSTFLVWKLQPWFENLSKRQIKAPKVYINDCGLLHSILDLPDADALSRHPKVGASFEGFAMQQIIRAIGARRDECYSWGLHSGAALDLLVIRGSRRFGFEVKRSESPEVTPSMRSAIESLQLNKLTVVHAGKHSYSMNDNIRAVAITRVLEDLDPL